MYSEAIKKSAIDDYDLSDYSGLGKLKILKKITKKLRKPVAAYAGLMTLGMIKPKVIGIKSSKAKKVFRKAGVVGRVAAAIVGAVVLGPPALAALQGAGAKALPFITGFLSKVKGLAPSVATKTAQNIMNGTEPMPEDLSYALDKQFPEYRRAEGKTLVPTKLSTAGLFDINPTTILLMMLAGTVVYMKFGKK